MNDPANTIATRFQAVLASHGWNEASAAMVSDKLYDFLSCRSGKASGTEFARNILASLRTERDLDDLWDEISVVD